MLSLRRHLGPNLKMPQIGYVEILLNLRNLWEILGLKNGCDRKMEKTI
jgi:hypothetical protein